MSNKKGDADFEYKGVPIMLTSDGKFSAVITGETVVKPTLAQIQRAIKAKPVFEKFTALRLNYGDLFEKVTVVGRIQRKPRYGYEPRYIVTNMTGSRSEETMNAIFPDTVENLEIAALIVEAKAEYNRKESLLIDEFNNQRNSLLSSLKKFQKLEAT